MKLSEDKVTKALKWILEILNRNQVPYQVVGGLAARIYGASRPIIDIDMYIPASSAAALQKELQDYVTKSLMRYLEDVWDIEYFQIIYEGQKIEFGLTPGAKIFDKTANKWVNQTIDFSKSVVGIFDQLEIKVIQKDDLISYKSILGRDVDIMDIRQI